MDIYYNNKKNFIDTLNLTICLDVLVISAQQFHSLINCQW